MDADTAAETDDAPDIAEPVPDASDDTDISDILDEAPTGIDEEDGDLT